MTRRVRPLPVILGVVLGLAAAAVVLPMLDGRGGPPGLHAGPLLSDCDGRLRDLVIHHVPESADITAGVYDGLLRHLPADVTVHVVCADAAAFDDLAGRAGTVQCTLAPVVVGHPITTWSRDRWLALESAQPGGPTVLLAPRGEDGADAWPERRGDERVAADLAAALGRSVTAARSDLYFDGGDFVADNETVFVTPAVLRRNLQRTVETREELIEHLSAALGRRVVLLDEAPDHHAGMFMMPVGDRTVLVGDPAAGLRLMDPEGDGAADALLPPEGADTSAETQRRFDAVARQCHEEGYRVVRIPMAPGRDGRTYLTHVNVILDGRDGRRVVTMPVFRGADALNDAAERTWRNLGWEVRRVDCTACYPHFGSLRCLVNVLRRG